MGAFLLVVRKHPGAPSPRRWLPEATAADLGFEPHERLDWSDQAGVAHLVSWEGETPGSCHEVDGGVAVVAGDLRHRGRQWGGSDGSSAAALWVEASGRSPAELREDLRGVFAAAVLDARGEGWVISDPVGHRCLYHGEDDDLLVVSTRACLAAQVLERDGGRPSRDVLATGWLALTTYRVGDHTGFERVRVAPPGSRLCLSGGRCSWERTDPFLVAPDDTLRSTSVEELAEVVLDDLADAVRGVLALPAERHVLSLTGGKDSRLVLAGALRAGAADALEYETVGPPGLADVQLATALAVELGLRHAVRFVGLAPSEPFGHRFRSFVEATGGMVSGWSVQADVSTSDLYLTGLCGELLRSCHKLPEGHREGQRVARAFGPQRIGRLGLLHPDARALLEEELLHRLAHEPDAAADPLDRAQAHFAGSRMRFTRIGPREELAGNRRVHPLYGALGLRAALSLDSLERQSEVLVAAMLRRASPRLTALPFTDGGWDRRATAYLGAAPPPPSPTVARPPASPSLVATLFAAPGEDRTDLLAEVFADAGNPAWGVLDRGAALAALDRYARLTAVERRELFGAASAAVWLAP